MIVRFVAAIAALLSLFFFMFVPLIGIRLFLGIPLDAKGLEGEGWLLVLGGAIGAGAARLSHHVILRKFGNLSQRDIDANWFGKRM